MVPFKKIECFKIQLLKADEGNILDFKKNETLYQQTCDGITATMDPATIIADPFLFVYRDTLYLFYERQTLHSVGVIMMTSTQDLKKWTQPISVLKESFHLSYPWVFEEDGHVYMIPETGTDKSIRLYEADDDSLTSFHLVKKLLEQPESDNFTMGYADTSIYKKDDVFYMHTTVGAAGENQLRLYYSDNLLGPYTKHKQSPIITSSKIGRNAGCLFEYKGKLLRPAQDCVHRYGDNVHLVQIEKMTKEEYQESVWKENIFDTTQEFYKEGGHQFNVVNFKGTTILATDAKEYHRFLLSRVRYKLSRILKCMM